MGLAILTHTILGVPFTFFDTIHQNPSLMIKVPIEKGSLRGLWV